MCPSIWRGSMSSAMLFAGKRKTISHMMDGWMSNCDGKKISIHSNSISYWPSLLFLPSSRFSVDNFCIVWRINNSRFNQLLRRLNNLQLLSRERNRRKERENVNYYCLLRRFVMLCNVGQTHLFLSCPNVICKIEKIIFKRFFPLRAMHKDRFSCGNWEWRLDEVTTCALRSSAANEITVRVTQDTDRAIERRKKC